MAELHFQRTENIVTVSLGERIVSLPLADLLPDEQTGRRLLTAPAPYGRDLYEAVFRDPDMQAMLAALPTNTRLLLDIDDPLLAAIPWEYLRDSNNRLLAGRVTMVRSVPEQYRTDDFTIREPLNIVAIPVSPVDDARVLNTEGEWRNLVEALTTSFPSKATTLTRVRPPTLDYMKRALNQQGTTIVHFMGHGTSQNGKGLLEFEDKRAHSHLVDAETFVNALNAHVLLVILNSCGSGTASSTDFGNIAQALVRQGVPYALGMQFTIDDNAAVVLSRALYDFLLQGHSIEDAVQQTRCALGEDTTLHYPAWLAGIPVLYTNLREPLPPMHLREGQPTIIPAPERLEQTCDLTALPEARHFLGRANEMGEVLDALLVPRARGFVLLHGLGGIGKTSLALAVGERVGWHYGDRVLGYSFESFVRFDDNDQRIINTAFAETFYTRLARFYDLDPGEYQTTIALQQAILQRRKHVRSLLILDNIETLLDVQKEDATARTLATFMSRLAEGQGVVFLTSRIEPGDWGECKTIEVKGLSEQAGADLFLALLPPDHTHLAPEADRLAFSARVEGHPLSIQLLAARFAENRVDLATFLTTIETELEEAEQATPASLEDPERQKTLYACMHYSVRRLTPEQRTVLDAVSIFQTPFPPGMLWQL